MKETKFSGAFAWLAVIMMVGVAFTGCVDSDDDDDNAAPVIDATDYDGDGVKNEDDPCPIDAEDKCDKATEVKGCIYSSADNYNPDANVDDGSCVYSNEQTIEIAGSSTVFPVASAWAQEFMSNNPNYKINVAGGGSGAGASRICSTDADHVDIGDMSRGWKSSEAAVADNGYIYECLDSEVTATQLQVAIDGLSVVVKRGGGADQCIADMGGLSVAQLRWIYSDWSESDLANHAEGGLDMSSVTPSNDNDGVREWSDLSDSPNCADSAVKLWGADSDSGTYEYFGETVLCKNCFAGKEGYDAEGFDDSRDGGYQNSADDNVIVTGVSGDDNAVGYFGYAYYEENAGVLNVVSISPDEVGGGNGDHVQPNAGTVGSGEYSPLARPIFMNVDKAAWEKVTPFLSFGFSKAGMDLVASVGYVALPPELLGDMLGRIADKGEGKWTGIELYKDTDGDGIYDKDDLCVNDATNTCPNAQTGSKTIEIAGSSTVYPVATAWAQKFMEANTQYTINVAGGGSGAGASRICSTDADHVDIGDMSRGWKSSEAAVAEDGYTYECLDSEVSATQLQVAIDGLSVVVKRGGDADKCAIAMGGLSVAQLRWIYSDWSESDLANNAEGGLDMSSVTPSNDNDGVREWSDLSDSPDCADSAIKLWGADSDSGTYEYFGETVLCKNCFAGKSGYPAEGFDDSRDGGYQNSADDNVIVNGVYGDDNAIGYFGYAYYEENADKLNVVSISPDEVGGGNDDHVTPSAGTVGSGEYSPLARPIFMNVDNTQWSLVSSFLQFGFSAQGAELVAEVGYVPIPGYLVAEMSRRIAEAGSHGGKITPDCSGANFDIAGSSTVFPVASAWAQEYMKRCSGKDITIAGGGSGAGASRMCSTDSDHVQIGDMSRGWKSSEAAVSEDGYTYDCLDSEVSATQLQVAIDGLSVVVKRGGDADKCIAAMGGLSVAQLRWIYSDWSESDLANHAEGGLDMSSVTPSNDNDGVREWSDLSDSSDCADSAIKLWGADSDSGTYEYFGETVFCKNCFAGKSGYDAEGFDNSRDGGYQNSADDNVIVEGVSGDDNAVGYFGYAYYEENAAVLNVVSISPDEVGGGNDDHVEPNAGTVGSGEYSPLARPIFMNVDNSAWEDVSGFLNFGFSAVGSHMVAEVGYVPLPSYLNNEMTRRIAEAGTHGGKFYVECRGLDGKTIEIAGSSTVYPVASAWAQAFQVYCDAQGSNVNINVAGGGSGAGASRICSTDTDHVDIGDMSRGWKTSEATVGADGYTYSCLDSEVTATQLQVAIDGLSVVVKRGGEADQCIAAMGGLSVAQLRWIYSDWSETDLAEHAEGGLDMSSVTPSNDNDGVREWSDLSDSADCADSAIKLWGADSDSGTYEYFGETVFCKNCFAGKSGYDSEGFDNSRDGGYQNSADDNVIVEGVSGDGMAIGYFGYAYYEENAAVLNVVAISGDEVGGGSTDYPYVTPSSETVASGEYAPLARPIFMNVDNSAWDLVLPFMQYGFYKHVGSDLVAEVGYVALTGDNLATMKHRIETASA